MRDSTRAHDDELAVHSHIAEAEQRTEQRGGRQNLENHSRNTKRDVSYRFREPVLRETHIIELTDEFDDGADRHQHHEHEAHAAQHTQDDVAIQSVHGAPLAQT